MHGNAFLTCAVTVATHNASQSAPHVNPYTSVGQVSRSATPATQSPEELGTVPASFRSPDGPLWATAPPPLRRGRPEQASVPRVVKIRSEGGGGGCAPGRLVSDGMTGIDPQRMSQVR